MTVVTTNTNSCSSVNVEQAQYSVIVCSFAERDNAIVKKKFLLLCYWYVLNKKQLFYIHWTLYTWKSIGSICVHLISNILNQWNLSISKHLTEYK